MFGAYAHLESAQTERKSTPRYGDEPEHCKLVDVDLIVCKVIGLNVILIDSLSETIIRSVTCDVVVIRIPHITME